MFIRFQRLFKIGGLMLTAICLLPPCISQQKRPKVATEDDNRIEMRLRMRLNVNPHDKQAHKELTSLLNKKYAFRAQMEEDGNWLKNNPDNYFDEIEMSSLAKTVDDPEYAIGIDRTVLAKANRADDPTDYDYVKDRFAFLLVDREQFGEALSILKHETDLSPTDAGVWENLADAQFKAGQFKEAVSSYRTSLNLDNNQEGTHEGLANALYKKGDIEGSETEMAATIAIYNAQYHGNATSDSFHQMMKGLVNVSKTDAALSKLHLKYAKLLLADKRFEEALTEVDSAARADGDLPYQYMRAEIYDAAQQPAKASAARNEAQVKITEMARKEAISKDAFFSMFTFPEELFMTESDEDDGFDQAQELITLLQPALASGKLKAADLLLLGNAYCTKVRISECRELSERAFKMEPKLDRSKTHYSLAQALEKGHDLTGARKHFQRAYELEPLNVTYRTDYEASRQN